MFELPSIWNLIVSTIVFFVTAWCVRRYLDEHEIPRGTTRGLLVFVMASLLSWGAGEMVDRIGGSQPAAQTANDPVRL